MNQEAEGPRKASNKKSLSIIENMEKSISFFRELRDRQQTIVDNMLGAEPMESKESRDKPEPMGYLGKIEDQLDTLYSIGTEISYITDRLEQIG